MTLREAARGQMVSGLRDYNIGFNDGDETQLTAWDIDELESLWNDFCEENGFQKNSVDYVGVAR